MPEHAIRWPLAALLLSACTVAPPAESAAAATSPDPRIAEVRLPAAAGWDAYLVRENRGVGIWTVRSFQVFPQYACPEVVGLDDLGRCHVMVSYSGKWTPSLVIEDGSWLGGLAHHDLDPRVAGAELYAGGKLGNLYQVVAYKEGVLDCRRIAHLPGREIHTIVAGDFDESVAGGELLVFTRPGGLYRLTPTAEHGKFAIEAVQEIAGRVRDAIPLPTTTGRPAEVVTVSRDGRLRLLRFAAGRPQWQTLYQAAMGMGRVALRPAGGDHGLTLYTTHDDGRILRHERRADGGFATEIIYRGPQGPRGIAAGHFGTAPGQETVAIFGYSKKVELLTRGPAGWRAETLFVDRDKGHFLDTAELDGRNDTREIVLSGYGGRVVLLARPPRHE